MRKLFICQDSVIVIYQTFSLMKPQQNWLVLYILLIFCISAKLKTIYRFTSILASLLNRANFLRFQNWFPFALLGNFELCFIYLLFVL